MKRRTQMMVSMALGSMEETRLRDITNVNGNRQSRETGEQDDLIRPSVIHYSNNSKESKIYKHQTTSDRRKSLFTCTKTSTDLHTSDIEDVYASVLPDSDFDQDEENKINQTGLKEKKRRYDRKNFCIFCEKLVKKLRRHLMNNHKSEPIVSQYIALFETCPNESQEQRKQIISDLTMAGNFKYNKTILSNSNVECVSELLPVKRPRLNQSKTYNPTDYVHCTICQGMFAKRHFYQHASKCKIKEDENRPDNSEDRHETDLDASPRKNCFLKKYALQVCPNAKQTNTNMEKHILNDVLTKDELGIKALQDSLLLDTVADFYNSHQARKDRTQITRKLRDGAKLIEVISSIDESVKELRDIYDPKKVGVVIEACQVMCKLVNNDMTLTSDATKVVVGMNGRLSWILEECGKKLLDNIISDESSSEETKRLFREKVNDFQVCLKRRWKYYISTNIESMRRLNKMSKPMVLPLDEDIKTFVNMLRNMEVTLEQELINRVTVETYEKLCKVIICHIITLNRRRPFEATNAEIKFYLQKQSDSEFYSEELLKTFADEEKVSLNELVSYTVPAKGTEAVATVLLTKSMDNCIKRIIECRKDLGLTNNKYLFARPGLESLFIGSKVLKEMVDVCPRLKRPEFLTANGLRHHVATHGHVMGLDFTTKLSKFMCHTQQVHDKNYVAPLQMLHRGVIGNYLTNLEGTKIAPNLVPNKVPIKEASCSVLERSSSTSQTNTFVFKDNISEGDALSEILDRRYDTENSSTNFEEESEMIRMKKTTGKKRWNDQEKRLVKEKFGHLFKEKINPGTKQCRQFLEEYGHLFQERTPAQLNSYIDNINKGKVKVF